VGDLNIKVYLNPQPNIRGNDGNVVNLGIIRKIASLRMLIKKRDLMMPLP
jgi:hypothetical protein